MKIVLCDDERVALEDWAASIEDASGEAPEVMPLDVFADVVHELNRRHVEAAGSGEWSAGRGPGFDDVDILILDYDLRYLVKGEFLTGETVAFLARCYSSCGLIVGLN